MNPFVCVIKQAHRFSKKNENLITVLLIGLITVDTKKLSFLMRRPVVPGVLIQHR